MTDDGRFLYRDDAKAILRWMHAQWREWLAPGAEGFELCMAAAAAPPGSEGDEARSRWTAATHVKAAAIMAGSDAKRDALAFRIDPPAAAD